MPRRKAKPSLSLDSKELAREIRAKRMWLAEAESTLQAIRQGEVDAVIVQDNEADKIMALKSFEELAADNAQLRSQVAERTRIETALHAAQEELRALSMRLLQAQDEERRRIARDLHDDIVQKLAALAIDADAAALNPTDHPSRVFRSIHSRIVEISMAIRDLAHGLHPAILTDLGLSIAVIRCAQEFSQRLGIKCMVKTDQVPLSVPAPVTTSLYRILLETLSNVQKHARADEVAIELTRNGDWLVLSVSDNGVGFLLGTKDHGLGFVSMRERAYMLDGIFTVESRPGVGTTVKVQVPLR